jgi:hypothetical protein
MAHETAQVPSDSRVPDELEELTRRASEAPGVAEILALHQQHAAFLAQANAYLFTRNRVVSFSTTDSAS